jgi:hypothetical protein
MHTRRLLACAAAAIVLLGYATGPSKADDPSGSLPGVNPLPPVVKPEGEPEMMPIADENGFVRMGDWDVKISGSVTLDVGAGDVSLPRR